MSAVGGNVRAAFLAGWNVQDSPLYGAERRGAPVVAFTRFADGPIRERGYIQKADAVVVMDAWLLERPEATVLDGVDDEEHDVGGLHGFVHLALDVVVDDVLVLAALDASGRRRVLLHREAPPRLGPRHRPSCPVAA